MRVPSRFTTLVTMVALVSACGGGATPAPTKALPASPSPSATVAPTPTAEASVPLTPEPTRGPLAWAQLAPSGGAPAGREDHTWTVDDADEVAYLFGGRDGATVHGDLWAYDLAADAWRRLEPPGAAPAARFGHEAAWVAGRGLVVFGGQAGSRFFGDLWLFDPAVGAWSVLRADGDAPVARYGSCSAVSPDGRLWISHGFTENGTRFDDTKAYDFDLGRWADETPADELPVKRCLHVCWWTADDRLALYGGQTNGDPALGDLWVLTPIAGGEGRTGWESLGTPLADRNLVAAVAIGDEVILFGGRDGDGRPLADLHLVSGDNLSFEALATTGDGPTARWASALIHDATRGRSLLFGGTDGSSASAETWALASP